MPHSEFVGVDGCQGGWFTVGFSSKGEPELRAFRTFEGLLDHYRRARLILVDMPIGLPDGGEERACDERAREELAGYRDRTVFPTPTRAATEYLANHPGNIQGANNVQLGITGEPLCNNTRTIMPKIAEVDSVLSARPTNAAPQVREIHPEILFWAMNEGEPMSWVPKSTRRGMQQRFEVLGRECPQTREILEASCPMITRAIFDAEEEDVDLIAFDDVLDALAAAVTAYRGYDQLQTLPTNPPPDSNGLPMEMVYWISQGG